MFGETNSLNRHKFTNLRSDQSLTSTDDDNLSGRHSSASASPSYYSGECNMSSWNQTSPYSKSPWSRASPAPWADDSYPYTGLLCSLVREEGHIYSLAASGELLYTGSDSKNIRVWKNQKEYSGFKSSSGLVKAIVLSGDRIFTGHQDGKIRIWKISPKNPTLYKKAGTLPRVKDLLKSSMNPNNYVKVRHHRNSIWIKHFDAISCLSLDADHGFLYSGSWDKTLKVWRVSDARCMESITVHDDAVNSVVAGFDGLVLTGSADGSVKVWRREVLGKTTKHTMVQTLLKQECAVTVLAKNPEGSVVYCGSSDGLVNFWDRSRQFAHGGVLRGHKLAVLCLTSIQNLIFSGSADKTICVWRRDGGSHTCLSVLTGHAGPVKCLAVEEASESSAEDRRFVIYSGSLDKSVKVWRVSELAPELLQPAPSQPSDAFDRSQPSAPSHSYSNKRY